MSERFSTGPLTVNRLFGEKSATGRTFRQTKDCLHLNRRSQRD